ncbi:MAG: hypothetical protein Q8O90_08600 [Elusimicrobiota bacterium]|nr:hypothetical protein [Elusimicrobiota bacterium]
MLFGYLYKVGHGHFSKHRDVHFRQIRIRRLLLVLVLALVLILALIGHPVVFHFLISPYILLLVIVISLSAPGAAIVRPVIVPVSVPVAAAAPAVLRFLRGRL